MFDISINCRLFRASACWRCCWTSAFRTTNAPWPPSLHRSLLMERPDRPGSLLYDSSTGLDWVSLAGLIRLHPVRSGFLGFEEVPPPFVLARQRQKLGQRRDKDGHNWTTNRRRDGKTQSNPVNHKNQFQSVETGRRFDFVFFADRSGAAVAGAHLRFIFHPGEKSQPNFPFHP